ncbi:hypothetical protein JXH92_003669 [Salmonella enterica subsp. enterica serovar 4,[5],12:b:-]|nr:hypothetical protein [Salmonella enterica subsp. enterica serovar 4,[5],12:b:-]
MEEFKYYKTISDFYWKNHPEETEAVTKLNQLAFALLSLDKRITALEEKPKKEKVKLTQEEYNKAVASCFEEFSKGI